VTVFRIDQIHEEFVREMAEQSGLTLQFEPLPDGYVGVGTSNHEEDEFLAKLAITGLELAPNQ
jgi:hypothetical protein